MGLYGPFTATAGTVQECDVAADAGGLYILNTSRFDLMLAFQAQKPTAASAFGGPPWYATVPAGDRRGVRIPQGVYGANGFPGYVWVLPVDNTGSLAFSGTTYVNAQFTIETYADPATMPPDYASAQWSNTASQSRMIPVPFGVIPFTGTNSPTAGGQFISILAQGLTPNQQANQVAVINVYSFHLSLSNLTTITGINLSLEVFSVKADLVTLVDGPFTLWIGYFYAGTQTAPHNGQVAFSPPEPWAYPISLHIANGAAGYGMRWHVLGVLSTPTMAWNIAISADSRNGQTAGDIGNGTIAPLGSTANPGVY